MRNHKLAGAVSALIGGVLIATTASAGVTVFKDGEKYVKLGGRIQLQYHQVDPDTGSTTDEVFFRRFRPYIEGSVHKDWKGKFQWDMGKAEDGNEVAVKDAYFQYKGFEGMKVTIGNANFPFSRELLTSSKKQQLVERTFVGDHNYGTPDRNLGIHLTGKRGDTLTWGASLASASIDPSSSKLDFDTPVNANSDFNEGWIIGGRVDFHPFGILKFSQGDFRGDTKATIGVGAFQWNNDDDNNQTGKANVDSVTGYEVSGAFRSSGFSVDAEYNSFNADAVDNTLNSGLYTNGDTNLENWSIEGGYMVMPGKLELVAGYQSQDADGYSDTWDRTSLGANWFLHKHDIKFQLSYRMGENVDGQSNVDEDEVFLQGQYVF